ncbi:putative exonuclease GOR [Anastrepha obliqua]|uniref:putative exonuclease GOR n=1 Tax=Anastrepha obliqua TaxID=95512 RepID=UPI002409AB1D|nr:putative exonuclease GOR [Anastrepha obliqua]
MDYFDSMLEQMQMMDYKVLSLLAVPILAVVVLAVVLLRITRKIPNAQHVPVYGVHQPTHRYYQPHQHLNNGMQCHYKGNVSDSSRARNNPNNQRRVPAQQQQQPQPQHNAKPRKARFNSKRSDNNGASTQKRTTDFAADDYFAHQRVYTYNRQYMSSRAEDNILAARHNPAHRSSTSSSGVAASDDLVSSSSNEDLSTVYSVISQPDKKAGKETGRRNRQQHHRKRHSEQNLVRIIPINGNEDSKENRRPGQQQAQCQNQQQQQQQQQPSKTANLNLRKTAALKAANTHTACSNTGGSTNAKSGKAASTSSETSSVSSSPTNSANCSPTASPTASKRNVENLRRVARAFVPRVQQHTKLNMSEGEFVQHLQRYVIDPNLLRIYGYPVESAIHEGCIEVQKCFPRPSAAHSSHTTSVVNIVDGLEISRTTSSSSSDSTTTATTNNIETQSTVGDNSSDSGQGSANSTPPSLDSDSSEAGEDEPATTTVCFTPNGQFQIFSQYDQSLEKQCVRCMRTFHVTESGEYLTHESCTFHWGKLHFNYVGNGYASQYTCCGGTKETEGCSHNHLHVWTGAVVGINGPYKNFVQTRLRSSYKSITPKVYALDTEMSFTGRGLEVTKVTMVGYDGQLVYEHFVRPDKPVVDYNTRFSGITEKDISSNDVKTLEEVQKDLLEFIDAETIVIGHALDNDLRVLRIVHKNIIDTSITFPHPSGFPYRRALKNLTKSYLHRDIQCSDAGHNSFEDSMACLELMMWKVRKDTLRPTAY